MTKAFSAAATLLWRDEGVLRPDDALSVHAHELAEVRGPTVDSPVITIRDLLTMRAGFITDDYWADRHLELTDEEFDEIIASGVTFAEPTGSAHEYSNFGFGVLGRVVHRASGQRIQQVISERSLAHSACTIRRGCNRHTTGGRVRSTGTTNGSTRRATTAA